MKKITFSIIIYLLVFAGVNKIFSQVSIGGTPASFSRNIDLSSIDKVYLQAPSLSEMEKQDDFSEKNGIEKRIGVSVTAELSPKNSGTWTELNNGSKIWQLEIISKGAKAIGLYYDKFEIPRGGKLFIYSEDKKQLLGAYTNINNPKKQEFATEFIYGDKLILEYNQPAFVKQELNIYIGEISYIYRGVAGFDKNTNWTEPSDDCEVNINCTPVGDNWQDEKRGIARIVLKNGSDYFYCTGTLINNTNQDCTPYFLTAYHCGGDASAEDHNQWMFYFNYESNNCTTPSNEPSSNSITGCTVKTTSDISGGTDLQLLELNTTPPQGYNPYYNGWDRSTSASPSGVGIHHPAGSIKKISTYTSSLQTGTYSGAATNVHWKVNWSSNSNGWGVTEGGSSGSPIFNNSGLVVGTLTGGLASCSAQNDPDYYGKMDKHWAYGNLETYLDPANTGVTSLQGTNVPCGSSTETCDTLDVFGLTTSNTAIYTVSDNNGGGYVTGTNGYGDTQKANFYSASLSSNNFLTRAIFFFYKATSGTNPNITFTAYNSNSGTPGSVITSKTVSLSDIVNAVDNFAGRYVVDFVNTQVSGDFFIGFSCGLNMANGDTIAVISTQDGEVGADISWEEYNGSWGKLSDSWNMNLALAIFPVMCPDANYVDIVENENNVFIYPNPTNSIINISGINNFEQLQIYDMQGKLVKNINNYTNTINVKGLLTGNYIIKIISDKTVITKKLIIK